MAANPFRLPPESVHGYYFRHTGNGRSIWVYLSTGFRFISFPLRLPRVSYLRPEHLLVRS